MQEIFAPRLIIKDESSVQTTKAIKSSFSVWSPTEIENTLAEITVPETYERMEYQYSNGWTTTLEPGLPYMWKHRCPGPGHLELAEPILAFIDNIHKLLLISCRSCSRLKVTQN